MKYQDQLKSPKWQKLREKIFEKRKYTCEICQSKDKQLHLHHKQYVKGRKAWMYHEDLLQVLCNDCHEEHHRDEQTDKYLSELCPECGADRWNHRGFGFQFCQKYECDGCIKGMQYCACQEEKIKNET